MLSTWKAVKDASINQKILINNSCLFQNVPFECKVKAMRTLKYISNNVVQLTGYEPVFLLSNKELLFSELISQEDLPDILKNIQTQLQRCNKYQIEYRIHTKWGGEKWIFEQGIGFFNKKGILISLKGILTDITNEKCSTDFLFESENRFQKLIENAPVGICIFYNDMITYVNPVFLKIFGIKSSNEALGTSLLNCIDPEQRESVKTLIQNCNQSTFTNNSHETVGLKNNEIRFFQVAQSYNKFPQTNCEGKWVVCDENSMPAFSAIGYFFGRRLNDQLKVPVGLIGSYWGGTCIQSWMPSEVFDKNKEINKMRDNIEAWEWAPKGADVLYNAMIFPFTPYRIAGAIWYQGEANVASESTEYNKLFTGLMEGWRSAFQYEIPIYYVQIAPYKGYEGIKSAYLREQQELAMKIPGTGMISVSDLTDDVNNIHPGKKRAVGERLSNLALKEQYGKKELQPYSPHFGQLTIKGNKAIVSVISIGKLNSNGQKITNFQLAGADKIFYPASATIEKDGSIQLASPNVKNPVDVRYCFSNEATSNLFDINHLPLLPFRTDK